MKFWTYLSVDELIFFGILMIMVFGIGSAPRLVRRFMGVSETPTPSRDSDV
jgi:hypothetical protein